MVSSADIVAVGGVAVCALAGYDNAKAAKMTAATDIVMKCFTAYSLTISLLRCDFLDVRYFAQTPRLKGARQLRLGSDHVGFG
jgi:hypothetical protein